VANRSSGIAYEHPIQLYGSIVVPASGEAALRGRALANTLAKTVEIHEIKFAVSRLTDEVGNQPFSQVSMGGVVSAHLSVGKVPLTNGPVPIWNLASIYSRWDEDSFALGPNEATSIYVWKFARPFHLPVGAQLQARFRHNGLVRQDATVRVAIAGKAVNRTPRTTFAPFASCFVGTPTDVAAALDESAPETALANVTDGPLQVDRFTGRVAAHEPSGTAIGGTTPIAYSDANHPEMSNLYSLRMLASDGRPIIRDPTPFRGVFPYATAAWECPHVMPPGAYYSLFVSKIAGVLTPYTWQRGQPFVGLVGSREVPL
jgi:hypothetical protein